MPGGDYQRILLIKPSSLGDLVHAMPALAALRDRFPAASFTWLVKSQWADLVERMEGVDEVWPVPPGLTGWLSQVPRLRAARFDLVIDLQGLLRSGAMSWLAGCPVRMGLSTAREGSRWFYTDEVPVETADIHAVERNLLVARALGAAVPSRPAFRFRSSEQDRTAAAALLEREGIRPGEAWIAMNVAARWPTKRWPPESFAQAADGLHKEGLGRVVLTGGPDERAEAEAVTRMMASKPADLTGRIPLGLLPALLKAASLMVTNDSGPMHVAAAVGTPVVALFGPTNPRLTGPYGGPHRVLVSGIACSPCYSRRCRHQVERECLRRLSPAAVVEAAREQMAARPAHGS